MTDNEARVIRIIAQQLGKQESKIKRTDKFIEDLSADSLDIVELIMALEDEFGTKIKDDEAELLTTVGDAIDYVEAKIQKGEAQ
ncbi:MAG: acyl carrier protein [Victivallales bacterium]|nr:acyl carrier protein [Victivallales bacterium]MBQ7177056.1 acyl carrier protein [Victivallales bacterium]MBR6372392.1 acyl carrier protein [Victivallales bacterium]